METISNVIVLKTAERLSIDMLPMEQVAGVLSREEGANLHLKAMKVLEEMEEMWETDHSNVELRDKFHLLKYYLVNLPVKHVKNIKKNKI